MQRNKTTFSYKHSSEIFDASASKQTFEADNKRHYKPADAVGGK